MDHFEEITLSDLHRALDAVEGKQPTKRLLAAIAYKKGISQTELADWYGVQRRTIYSWLKRFEERPIESAVCDADRSGRPRKLTVDQRASLEQALHRPPRECSFEGAAWTPELVRRYVRERFEIEYSLPSCRRLMKESGLSYRSPRPNGSSGFAERRLDAEQKHWLPRDSN